MISASGYMNLQYGRRLAFFLAGAAAFAAIITTIYRHAASGRRVPGFTQRIELVRAESEG